VTPRDEQGFFSVISILMTLVIMGIMAAIVVKAMGDLDEKAGQPSPIDLLNGTASTTVAGGTAPGVPGGGPGSGAPAASGGNGSVQGAAGLAAGGIAGGMVAGAAGIAATGGGGKAPSGIRGDAIASACQGDYRSAARALTLSTASGGPPVTSTADLVARGFLAAAPANPKYSIEIRPGPDGVTPQVFANGQPSIAGCG